MLRNGSKRSILMSGSVVAFAATTGMSGIPMAMVR